MKHNFGSPQRVELANASRILINRDTRFETASLAVCLLGGLRGETPEIAGSTHLLEHLLFKRTRKSSPRQIAEQLDLFGGEINGFTDAEMLCLHGTVPGNRIDEALSLFAELLCEADFSDDDFSKEREVVRQELLERLDDPGDTAYRGFCRVFWPQSMLAEPVCGSEESLQALTPRILRKQLFDSLVGSRLLIACSGAVDPDQVCQRVEQVFGALPQGLPVQFAVPRTQSGVIVTERPVSQVHVLLGCPWPHLRSPHYSVSEAIVSVLGEGMASRFFQTFREERGLAYDIQCSSELFADTAAFEVSAVVDRGMLNELLELVMQELEKLSEHGIEENELHRIREVAAGVLALERDSKDSIMWRAIESELTHGRYISPEEDLALLNQVTSADCQRLLEHYLLPGSFAASFAGDVREEDISPKLINWCVSQ